MGKYSPEWMKMVEQNKGSNKTRTEIADFEKKIYPDLTSFMTAFAVCIRAIKMSKKELWRPETAFSDCALLPMSDRSRPLFFDREMLVALFKMGYSTEANADIAAHVSWNDEEHSALILSCLAESITKSTTQQHIGNALSVLDRLLGVNDDLMFWRVAVLFQSRDYGFLTLLKSSIESSLVEMLIEWLVLNMRNRPFVIGWLLHTRDLWRSNVLDLVANRIRSLKASGAPEQRIQAMQDNFTLLEQVASDSLPEQVEHFWDDTFTLSNYSVHSVPRDPARK
jgi:hypothetical protein